jgi:(E)-4-hydroxy-3-methylbut-2-enyl-diphosphate synthase
MIISLKASHVPTAVECYTLFAQKSDYPTHVGITEAGSREYGTLKSAAGIGAILLRGVGDTIRVSLLGDPVPEIAAGFDILRACDRRVTRPEVVACPTCGRLDIDLERIVAEVEEKMKNLPNPLRISILGCLVNGFGEAKEADLGIAAGSGKGVIFKRGVPIRNVLEADMVQALWEEVMRFDEDTPPLESYAAKQKQKEAKAGKLTVIS